MIENHLTHFIASDAHHETVRPFKMKSILKIKIKRLRNRFRRFYEEFRICS